jgi:hypothetical protein
MYNLRMPEPQTEQAEIDQGSIAVNFVATETKRQNETAEPYGKRIIGIEDPEKMTQGEFNQSKQLLFHGSDGPFEFNPKFDYSDPQSLATKDGSLTLGLGFYTTPVKTEAENYSMVRQVESEKPPVYIQALLPKDAVMFDCRERWTKRNAPIPKELFEKWREEFVRYYKDQDRSKLPWYETQFQDEYLKHLDVLAQFPDIDLRSMLWTGADNRTHDGWYPSPSWVELFAKFMKKEGYDGVIYNEGGEGKNAKGSATYCFFNTEVIDTYEGWQKRKVGATVLPPSSPQ